MLVSVQGHGRYRWDSMLSPQKLLDTFQELHQIPRSLIDWANMRGLKQEIRRLRSSHLDLGLLTIQEQPLGQLLYHA